MNRNLPTMAAVQITAVNMRGKTCPTGDMPDGIYTAPEPPWYDPPEHLSYVVGTGTYQQWQRFYNWKQACNEVAALCGDPLPFPPKQLPKVVLKLREPPAFSFKEVAANLTDEIENARKSQLEQDMAAGKPFVPYQQRVG